MSWIPDKDHPIWKLFQGLISLAALYIFFHSHVPDEKFIGGDDIIGLTGAGIASKLAFQFFRSNGKE